jgi:Methyltransferase domain
VCFSFSFSIGTPANAVQTRTTTESPTVQNQRARANASYVTTATKIPNAIQTAMIPLCKLIESTIVISIPVPSIMVALRRKALNNSNIKQRCQQAGLYHGIIIAVVSWVLLLLWLLTHRTPSWSANSLLFRSLLSDGTGSSTSSSSSYLSYSAALTTIRCLTTPGCFPSLQCRSKTFPQKIQRRKKWEEQSFCIDDLKLRQNDCLVYSIGIHDSWEWEEKMAKLFGCQVFAFDPTQTYAQDLAPGVQFHSLGLQGVGTDMTATHGIEYAAIPSTKLRTLDQLMAQFGHTKLDVLMLDCEGCEWGVLRQMWCDTGKHTKKAPNVDQMVIEMHFQKSLGLANDRDVLVAAEAILCMKDARWGITSMELSGADRRDSEWYARDVSSVLQDTPTFLLNAAFRRIPDQDPLPHQLLEVWAHHSQVWFTAREKCLPALDKLPADQRNSPPPDVKALCDDYAAMGVNMNVATHAYRNVVRERAVFDEYERYPEPSATIPTPQKLNKRFGAPAKKTTQ